MVFYWVQVSEAVCIPPCCQDFEKCLQNLLFIEKLLHTGCEQLYLPEILHHEFFFLKFIKNITRFGVSNLCDAFGMVDGLLQQLGKMVIFKNNLIDFKNEQFGKSYYNKFALPKSG